MRTRRRSPPSATPGPSCSGGRRQWRSDLLLAGKKLLLPGVLTPGSIAYDCARIAQDEGAEVLLTGFGRGMSLTQKSARRLTPVPAVLEVDINNGADLIALTEELQRRWGRLDGCLHAIAYAPPDSIGGNFMTPPGETLAPPLHPSPLSLQHPPSPLF